MTMKCDFFKLSVLFFWFYLNIFNSHYSDVFNIILNKTFMLVAPHFFIAFSFIYSYSRCKLCLP